MSCMICLLHGEAVVYENQELPLSLYCTAVTLDSNEIKYKELFDKLHDAIHKSKNKKRGN